MTSVISVFYFYTRLEVTNVQKVLLLTFEISTDLIKPVLMKLLKTYLIGTSWLYNSAVSNELARNDLQISNK